jgi:NCAIR mutase (PurE)-related protein
MNKKYLLAGVGILAAFAFGRYSAPEKVKIETKVVEVEKKSENKSTDTDRNKRKETTVTETVYPDGRKETKTEVVETTQTERKTDTSVVTEREKDAAETKETSRSGKVSLSALTGVDVTNLNAPIFGAHLLTNVLGPVTIGVWGLSNATGGLSLGLSF